MLIKGTILIDQLIGTTAVGQIYGYTVMIASDQAYPSAPLCLDGWTFAKSAW